MMSVADFFSIISLSTVAFALALYAIWEVLEP